jgi:uncharacterized membrane protein YsdA (DUF1294 family)
MKPRRSGAGAWLLVLAFGAEVALVFVSKMDLPIVALIHIGAFSVFTFAAFAWDKMKAIRGTDRVREATLLSASVLGGALGGLAAMLVTRHKTRRPLFWFVLCLALFGHITLVGWLFIKR